MREDRTCPTNVAMLTSNHDNRLLNITAASSFSFYPTNDIPGNIKLPIEIRNPDKEIHRIDEEIDVGRHKRSISFLTGWKLC